MDADAYWERDKAPSSTMHVTAAMKTKLTPRETLRPRQPHLAFTAYKALPPTSSDPFTIPRSFTTAYIFPSHSVASNAEEVDPGDGRLLHRGSRSEYPQGLYSKPLCGRRCSWKFRTRRGRVSLSGRTKR